MTSQVENDFLRFVMMLYEIVPPVCKDYFNHNVLTRADYNGDLKTFLNKHIHDIYHLVYNVRCCQCGNPSAANNNNNRLFGKQFEKLYEEKNAREQGHVRWGPGRKIIQHCICGYTVVEVCSIDEMDISTVNALIQTCVQGINPSHSMWLNQIIKKRNKLCHIEDICALTKDKLNTMRACIEGSILGLAQCIPPESSYKKGIERELKLLKRCDFQREEVEPLLNSIREESVLMKETMCQIFTKLNGVIEQFPKMEKCIAHGCSSIKEESRLHKQELIGATKEISDQVGAQKAIIEDNTNKILETITDKSQKVEEKLNSISKDFKKGSFQHQNHEVTFEVRWTEKEQVPNNRECKDDVVVTWTINKPSCTEEEKAEIIKNIRKMVETAAIWSPYKIKCTGIGSIVIATMLKKDVFSDKDTFELSIRQFLDRFLSVSGINCQSPCTVKVDIFISKDIPNEILNSEKTDLLLAKYFDKEQQVVPEMMESVSESSIDLPILCSISGKGEMVLPWLYRVEEKDILLIADMSDNCILQQIKQVIESSFSVNTSDIDVRTLISSRPNNIGEIFVVVATSHTRRTVINTILDLLQCPKRIDLVPNDGMRYGYSNTESITLDGGQNWRDRIIFHIYRSQNFGDSSESKVIDEDQNWKEKSIFNKNKDLRNIKFIALSDEEPDDKRRMPIELLGKQEKATRRQRVVSQRKTNEDAYNIPKASTFSTDSSTEVEKDERKTDHDQVISVRRTRSIQDSPTDRENLLPKYRFTTVPLDDEKLIVENKSPKLTVTHSIEEEMPIKTVSRTGLSDSVKPDDTCEARTQYCLLQREPVTMDEPITFYPYEEIMEMESDIPSSATNKQKIKRDKKSGELILFSPTEIMEMESDIPTSAKNKQKIKRDKKSCELM